ncbi:LacI family transcriptional regulator [Azospirillum sp. TSA6c]|nr:LacI family transcriptional regulator [Azospirillum sp. TSA6c]
MSERDPKPGPAPRASGAPAVSGAPRAPRAVDVAAAAEVSIATVSRVFNNPEKVAPAIRERVLATAKAMGWMPHAAGSALARRRTSIVGAVIPTLDNEVFAAQVGAMQAAFADRGITLLLSCFNYDQDQAAHDVQAMLARGVEALAIVGEAHRPDLFASIQARHIPYIVTYSHRPDSPHPCIGFDNRQAFYTIARHLLDLGHETIGVIIQPTAGNDRVAARLDGVREALAERGLGIRPQHLCEGEWSIDFGRQSVRAMLATDPPPTAVICGNDYLALGALLEARAMGLSVPHDLSITGFDDIAISRQLDPPLTTMHVDNHEIGRRAAAYLLACLEGSRPSALPPLVPTLIRRGTTAAPRR